jgi:hypothetical protein
MTNQEINEAVARKLGWVFDNSKEAKWNNRFPWYDAKGKGHLAPGFTYSIEEAWEIVEHLGPRFHKLWRFWDDGSYIFEISDGSLVVGPPKIDVVVGEADTAPMAICLAFLKLP